MIDFHCHSSASDGSDSPSELARRVKEAGLSAFALTDHDTARGIPEARRASSLYGLRLIPGVELTGYHANREWHVQAIAIEAEGDPVAERLKPFVRRRDDRMREMLHGLRSEGVHIDFDEVVREAAGGVVSRMHLASLMVKKGLVRRHRDAYRRFIGDNAPYYVPKLAFSVRQAIELAFELGGVPVLAHPAIPGLDKHIPQFVQWGLVGIEALTPKHTVARERQYQKMAADLGIIATAGTDYHGKRYETSPGARKAPESVLDRLLEYRQAVLKSKG